MQRQIVLIFLASLMISGCAEPPSLDYDILRATDTENPRSHIDLLRQQGERIAGTDFISGNKVVLLRDGKQAYPAMLAAIRSAKHRIDMESFTFDGKEGEDFARALLKRHAAGAQVNLIYDAIGSSDMPSDLFDHMRAMGIHLLQYNPIDVPSVMDSSFNHRDHRKLLMIDGKVAFTGGVNISEVYRMKSRLKRFFDVRSQDIDIEHMPWRDTQVRIEGPVVAEFEHLFMQTWHDNGGDGIRSAPPTPTTPKGDLFVQAIDGAPDRDRFTIYRSLLVSIALAQKSIHLTAAYFVPTPDLVDALENAAQRGVDVVLILPSRSDSDLALKAGHSFYEDLMESGVQIYERQDVVLHAKTAVIDSLWSTVGSSNLDWRSVLFNNECNAVILGKNFGQRMEAMFRDDLAQSKRIDPGEWGERPLWERLDEWKASLVEYFL